MNESRPKIEGHEAYHEAGLSLLVAQFAMGESVDYSVRPLGLVNTIRSRLPPINTYFNLQNNQAGKT